MRFRTPKLLLSLLLLSGSVGYADTSFDFSYTFDWSPDTFGGTFLGDQNGDLIKINSLVNVWVKRDGDTTPTFVDATVLGGWDPAASWWSADAVMSPTLLLNNFALIDPDMFGTFLFNIAPDDTGAVLAHGNHDPLVPSDDDYLGSANGPSGIGTWSLRQTPPSSVPDGGSTAALLVLSFAAFGLLRRRR